MRRGTVARIMASVITTVFIALIRTNAHPEMWQVALLTLGLYECGVMFIQIAQREARKSRRNKIIRSDSRMPGAGRKNGSIRTGR